MPPSPEPVAAKVSEGGPLEVPVDPSGLHVLLAESNTEERNAHATLLRSLFYKVTAVASSKQALELLAPSLARPNERSEFDIILKEHEPPSANVHKLLKTILKYEALKGIPVVVISNQDDKATVLSCLQLGASDYMVKPLRENELRNLWTRVWCRRLTLSSASPTRLINDNPYAIGPSPFNEEDGSEGEDDGDDRADDNNAAAAGATVQPAEAPSALKGKHTADPDSAGKKEGQGSDGSDDGNAEKCGSGSGSGNAEKCGNAEGNGSRGGTKNGGSGSGSGTSARVPNAPSSTGKFGAGAFGWYLPSGRGTKRPAPDDAAAAMLPMPTPTCVTQGGGSGGVNAESEPLSVEGVLVRAKAEAARRLRSDAPSPSGSSAGAETSRPECHKSKEPGPQPDSAQGPSLHGMDPPPPPQLRSGSAAGDGVAALPNGSCSQPVAERFPMGGSPMPASSNPATSMTPNTMASMGPVMTPWGWALGPDSLSSATAPVPPWMANSSMVPPWMHYGMPPGGSMSQNPMGMQMMAQFVAMNGMSLSGEWAQAAVQAQAYANQGQARSVPPSGARLPHAPVPTAHPKSPPGSRVVPTPSGSVMEAQMPLSSDFDANGVVSDDGPELSRGERRRRALEKYRQKRKTLNFSKRIRYASRKQLAEARPRSRGQFVKCAANAGESGAEGTTDAGEVTGEEVNDDDDDMEDCA